MYYITVVFDIACMRVTVLFLELLPLVTEHVQQERVIW